MSGKKGQAQRPWPGGHTSSSFTVASVLDEFYGPKVDLGFLKQFLEQYRAVIARERSDEAVSLSLTAPRFPNP